MKHIPKNKKRIGYSILLYPIIFIILYLIFCFTVPILGDALGIPLAFMIIIADVIFNKLIHFNNILVNLLAILIPAYILSVWLLSAFSFIFYGDRRRKVLIKLLTAVLIAFPLYNIVPLLVCERLRVAPYLLLNAASLCAGILLSIYKRHRKPNNII